MGEYEELFKFAAKAGALESYLFERDKVEPLNNWISNLLNMYASLPDTIKKDIRDEFSRVLTKTLTYGEKVLEAELKTKLNNLLLSL
ncbi:hypothetical protein ACFLTZ_06140 [Chloroflexota bacterium]